MFELFFPLILYLIFVVGFGIMRIKRNQQPSKSKKKFSDYFNDLVEEFAQEFKKETNHSSYDSTEDAINETVSVEENFISLEDDPTYEDFEAYWDSYESNFDTDVFEVDTYDYIDDGESILIEEDTIQIVTANPAKVFDNVSMKQALIISEILQKPKSLR